MQPVRRNAIHRRPYPTLQGMQASLSLQPINTSYKPLFDPLPQSPSLVVSDTQSDSIQFLNFAKNNSFNIRFNIALPKIQFKILLSLSGDLGISLV